MVLSASNYLSDISIHTFLAEGDALADPAAQAVWEISIHTFLAEGDTDGRDLGADGQDFNPHLPRGR